MTNEQWQAAWKLYQSGISIPADQIQSFLDNASNDPLVREEVLAMFRKTQANGTLDRVGRMVGRYVLTARIGQGGMGEVYAARDSDLGRLVAVKLVAASSGGVSPLSRFIREAKAASALNHPNIVTIHEVIHSTSALAIVMELVEGTSLRELIGTFLPMDRVIHLGQQIAGALAAAHAHGIVHCDVKPENLMVRKDGLVKVLDFGLARDLASVTSTSVLPAGTLRYMSPEQLRGESPSPESDVFALGIVLYEIASGAYPFESGSIFETLKSLNDSRPAPPSALNSFVPGPLDALILRMLAKDPRERPSAAEVSRLLASDLRGVPIPVLQSGPVFQEDGPRDVKAFRPVRSRARPDVGWKATAGVLALVTLLSLWRPWIAGSPPIRYAPLRLDLDLGSDVSFGATVGPAVIVSPDATRLVFVSQDQGGIARLRTRRLDESKSVLLLQTENAYAPFFSPDGQWVGFFADGKLKKVRIDGGAPVLLCDANSGRGASWGEDGNIVAALDAQAGLWQIPQEGGKPNPLTRLNLDGGESTHRWPQVLPGGKAVLFNMNTAHGNWDESRIAVFSLRGGHIKILPNQAGMYPRYLSSGHIVYASKGTLFAVPFDLSSLEIRGPAVRVEQVSSNSSLGAAQIDFSRNGTFVYRTVAADELRSMQWVDNRGTTVALNLEPAVYLVPRLSPDGNRLAYVVSRGSTTDLWVYDLQRGAKTRLATDQNFYPVWSPDGRFLVFQTASGIFWTRGDGAGTPQPLLRSQRALYPSSFTPDGKQLLYSEQMVDGGAEIRTVSVTIQADQLQAGKVKLVLRTLAALAFPAISADGGWLAYADAEGGRYEICVRAFPGNGTKVQISTDGGTMPVWSRSRHELFYRTADQRIMVTAYSVKGDSFVADKPQLWSGKKLADIGLGINFDLAPDGKRVVAVMPIEDTKSRATQSHVMVVANFFAEIQKRLP